jgi:capsid protein
LTTTEAGRREFKSVEAKNFVYIARRTEANQVRGESCFAQVFDLLNQVDLYVDAVVIAARMAAIFGLIFKERTAQQQFGALPTMTNAKGDAQRAVTLENGLVKYVGQQDDVVQVQAQQPMSQTPDFVRAMLRMIGLPFDMPLEIIARDMSKVNFISGRLGLAGYYRAKDVEARAYAHHWSRIYQWWISKMVKSGELSEQAPDRFWNHEFTRSPGAMADPRGELQAALLEISMGIQSPQRYAASLGRDYESIQRQLDEIGWPRGGVLSTFTRDAGQLPPESNDENTQE